MARPAPPDGNRQNQAYERLATVAGQLPDGYTEILSLIIDNLLQVDPDARVGAIRWMHDAGWYRGRKQ
jgi:hypothetical protein